MKHAVAPASRRQKQCVVAQGPPCDPAACSPSPRNAAALESELCATSCSGAVSASRVRRWGRRRYSQALAYDSFGNMTCQTNGGTNGYCPNYAFNETTNQINSPGFQYDPDGNLTSDGSHSYQYDAEGHLTGIDNGSTASFSYNAVGQRVEDKWSYQLEFQYDLFGHLVGRYSAGEGRWWNGQIWWRNRALTRTWGASLEHGSPIGTSNMTTMYDGSVGMDELMYPWGQVWAYNGDVYGAYFAGLDGDPEPPQNIYPAQNRMYNNNIGRWFTPDPLGGNIADPQSLNRYAYALNNPETLTDPSGLGNCDALKPDEGAYCGNNTGPWTGCTMDGISTPCSVVGGALQRGFAAQCPASGCTTYGADPYSGEPTFLQFTAGAGGATGYLSTYDWTQGVNEINGMFLFNIGYQAYLRGNMLDAINAQLGAAIDALEAKGASPGQIKAFVDFESKNFNDIYAPYVEGGNVNFSSSGPGFNFANFGCAAGRCDLGALGALDFSHNNGYFHLDTSDPWSGLRPALTHLGVDLIGGNSLYWVIPRQP